MTGNSKLVYDERVLPPEESGTLKTVRAYREVEFRRMLGPTLQDAGIRPSVRRMIVMKAGPRKAPFSPDGPLSWGEIDVVRTDVFNPAVIPGLLPGIAVREGQSWRVAAEAVAELTDMEKVEEGELIVKFVAITTVNDRRCARLEISGKVRGVNEDGPNRQMLEGNAYFDIEARVLTYLSLKGTHELLDGKGQLAGEIKGQFTLKRTVGTLPSDLSDAALRGLELKPSFENSLLLYDNPDLGIRFLYPRSWRVEAVQGKQVTLNQQRSGSGILLTVEPVAKVPSAEEYLKEIGEYLKQVKANDPRLSEPITRMRAEPPLDRFTIEAEIGGEKSRIEYAVLKQSEGGVTAAARVPAAHAATLKPDIERILRSIAVTRTIEAK